MFTSVLWPSNSVMHRIGGLLLYKLLYAANRRVCSCIANPFYCLFSFRSADLKLIDFGSACKEEQTVYTYIQVELWVSF